MHISFGSLQKPDIPGLACLFKSSPLLHSLKIDVNGREDNARDGPGHLSTSNSQLLQLFFQTLRMQRMAQSLKISVSLRTWGVERMRPPKTDRRRGNSTRGALW
ncbi:hypothetical protein ACFX13_028559 [Malus domestica]